MGKTGHILKSFSVITAQAGMASTRSISVTTRGKQDVETFLNVGMEYGNW